jgi:hypothetical protein
MGGPSRQLGSHGLAPGRQGGPGGLGGQNRPGLGVGPRGPNGPGTSPGGSLRPGGGLGSGTRVSLSSGGPGSVSPNGAGRPGNPGFSGGAGGAGGPGSPGRSGGPGSPNGPQWPDSSEGLGGLSALAGSGAAATNSSPTSTINEQALTTAAEQVRSNYSQNASSQGNWSRYSDAWKAAGLAATAYASSNPSWSDYAAYAGYSSGSDGYGAAAVYYDYGSNVVYSGSTVYVNGDSAGTQEQYAQQAVTIADTGKRDQVSTQDEWMPLGVFAMVRGAQVSANDLFQLAVNKAGVIRGNYYNALSDTTLPVYGSVDQKTQRAAWTVGDRKERVFEAGIANLTKSETTMLVHFGKGRAQQWTLIRIEQSPSDTKNGVP